MSKKIYYLKLKNSKKFVKLDKEDYEKCKNCTWRLNHKGYPKARGKGLIHRWILGLEKGDGKSVHHINKNKLDARKENLKVFGTAEEHADFHKKEDKKEGKNK